MLPLQWWDKGIQWCNLMSWQRRISVGRSWSNCNLFIEVRRTVFIYLQFRPNGHHIHFKQHGEWSSGTNREGHEAVSITVVEEYQSHLTCRHWGKARSQIINILKQIRYLEYGRGDQHVREWSQVFWGHLPSKIRTNNRLGKTNPLTRGSEEWWGSLLAISYRKLVWNRTTLNSLSHRTSWHQLPS
jgi:hypothetical protein